MNPVSLVLIAIVAALVFHDLDLSISPNFVSRLPLNISMCFGSFVLLNRRQKDDAGSGGARRVRP